MTMMTLPPQTMNVRVGDQFQVTLDENPSTGFTWSFYMVQPIFAANGDEFRPKAGVRMQVGAGGTRTFKFTATAVGSGAITFEQRRGNEVATKHVVDVKVLPKSGNGQMAPMAQLPTMTVPQIPGMPKITMPQMPGMPPMPPMPGMPMMPSMPQMPAIQPGAPSSSKPAVQPAAPMVQRTVNVAVGEKITIDIEGNPTTGYNWEFFGPTDLVKMMWSDYHNKAAPAGVTGAGGVFLWEMEAAVPGSAVLTFGYKRAHDKQPADTYRVQLNVRRGGNASHGINQNLNATVGDDFKIMLDSNATTGYQWEYVGPINIAPNNVVRMTSSEYQNAAAPAGMVGVGGKQIFHFVATAPGADLISFNYKRSWEKAPVETYTVSVRVSPRH
ncbi:hypothetical protein AMAG_06653 [Allomyces macrogynus ATCC 38327]|uniref:Proteinase inhibitor I42 chagasin domain-containing protein n=1 Tax=Allomyces macrogynus (strain ATCC 38327) TaxID=578462 RepID=A0A0L0SEL6_ALLM3|nr:hypothetical protein AMAG_06653 [Allomyces macrogynus ATCC 38327]|eukprot:KNE60892.1 hypothetical protein AMAG_06653 [Allomyces macrogynus ATCC 38327]